MVHLSHLYMTTGKTIALTRQTFVDTVTSQKDRFNLPSSPAFSTTFSVLYLSSQSYGFSSSHVQMWEVDHKEGWSLKNWCFKLWCWRRLLRVPWSTRRSNQSILKEINSEYLLEGLMLKLSFNTLATWCKEPTHWKRSWCWERLRAGGEGDDRGWMVGWHHWLNGQEFEKILGDSGGQRSLACCSRWGHKELDITWGLNN